MCSILNHDGKMKLRKTKEEQKVQKNEEDVLQSRTKVEHPNRLLRMFANEKWYVCVYSLVLASDFMQSTYFFGTLSTIEKNFQLSATMLGILRSTFEIGYLATSITFAYFIGKGNKIRWISIALLINGIFCLVRIIPHYIDTEVSMKTQSSKDIIWTQYSLYFFIIAQMISGSCRAILRTSGLIYLVHNTEKNTFPMLFAIVTAVGDLGRFLGYMISFYALKIYVYPAESARYLDKSYQWIGAWWLGWIPISAMFIALSAIVIIFPQSLPAKQLKNTTHQQNRNDKISISDFYASCKRIFRNKVAVLDILVEISIEIGFSGYEIFLPKYLESQYGLTSSLSSFSLAILKLIERPISMLVTGFSIFKFKPKPRSLITCNIIMRLIQIGVMTSFIFISCPQEKIQGNWIQNHSLNLTTECNIHNTCPDNTKYSPVCNAKHELLFFSPCHAGCVPVTKTQDMKVHNNCSCVPNFGPVTEGLCPTDCKLAVIIFLTTNILFTSFIYAPIRFAERILRFRIVEDEDKSLHYGIRKFLPSVFVLLSSIVYGSMIDHSCLIFDSTSSGKGHCLIYNLIELRYSMNFFAIGGVLISVILEIFLWRYVKSVKMYDEDVQTNNSQTVDYETEVTEAFIQK